MSRDPDDFDTGAGRTNRGDGRAASTSRRKLLAGTGVALGAGVLGIGGTALAHDDDGSDGSDGRHGCDLGEGTSDVALLKYALTLERLEAAFYQRGLEMFDDGSFRSANKLGPFGDQVTNLVRGFVETLGNHEQTHADQIETVLVQLGEEPDDPPEFTFSFETVDEFLVTGRALENTGVAAYAGAAPSIQDRNILAAALSIHSVEARHAAFLNGITGVSPFPDAFDPALSMDEVLATVDPFIEDGAVTETPATETQTETPATETQTETATGETATETATGDTPTETSGCE